MAGGDDHVRLVARRRRRDHDRAVAAARHIVADQAGIVDHALLRRDRERDGGAFRNAVLRHGLGRGRMGRADDEVSLGAGRRQGAVGQLRRARIVRVVRIARRRLGAEVEACRVDEEGRRMVAGVGAGGNGHVLGDACRLSQGGRHEPHGRHQRPCDNGQYAVHFLLPESASLICSSSREVWRAAGWRSIPMEPMLGFGRDRALSMNWRDTG